MPLFSFAPFFPFAAQILLPGQDCQNYPCKIDGIVSVFFTGSVHSSWNVLFCYQFAAKQQDKLKVLICFKLCMPFTNTFTRKWHICAPWALWSNGFCASAASPIKYAEPHYFQSYISLRGFRYKEVHAGMLFIHTAQVPAIHNIKRTPRILSVIFDWKQIRKHLQIQLIHLQITILNTLNFFLKRSTNFATALFQENFSERIQRKSERKRGKAFAIAFLSLNFPLNSCDCGPKTDL